MMDFCLRDLQKEFLLEFCRIEFREIALKNAYHKDKHLKDAYHIFIAS